MDIFSKNLRKYRKSIGLSQAKLADYVGVKPNTISNYESGVSSPDLEMFVKIIKILDVDAGLILGISSKGNKQESEVNSNIKDEPIKFNIPKAIQQAEINKLNRTIVRLAMRNDDLEIENKSLKALVEQEH